MRSLDNFFKAASNNCWCKGSWAAVAGQDRRERGGCTSCIVKFEKHDTRAVRWLKTGTTSFVGDLYCGAFQAYTLCMLINSSKLSEKGEETERTWQSGRGHRRAVGVIKALFGHRHSQSAANLRFMQAGGAYNWLFVAVWEANMCVCLCLPPQLWRHICVYLYLPGKTNKGQRVYRILYIVVLKSNAPSERMSIEKWFINNSFLIILKS